MIQKIRSDDRKYFCNNIIHSGFNSPSDIYRLLCLSVRMFKLIINNQFGKKSVQNSTQKKVDMHKLILEHIVLYKKYYTKQFNEASIQLQSWSPDRDKSQHGEQDD